MSGTGLLTLTGALAASLLLVVAGVAHVRRPAQLAGDVRAHRVRTVAGTSGTAAAAMLGLVEIAAGSTAVGGAALGARMLLAAALAAQTVLYGAFAVHLLRVLAAGGRGLPCGCGLPEVPVGPGAAARAGGLGLLGAAGAVWALTDWQPPGDAGAGGVLLLAVAAPTLALLLAVVQPARTRPGTAAVPRPAPSMTTTGGAR